MLQPRPFFREHSLMIKPCWRHCNFPPQLSVSRQPAERHLPGHTFYDLTSLAAPVFFVDAAWKLQQVHHYAPAGLGIFIQNPATPLCQSIYISASTPRVTSALQAEAFGVLLATKLAELLHCQGAIILTYNRTLSSAAANKLIDDPGHWQIVPQLAAVFSSSAFSSSRIFHIGRQHNFKAHHQVQLALPLLNKDVAFRFLYNHQPPGMCPVLIWNLPL